jgi:diphosphomevalonate decarboxylase
MTTAIAEAHPNIAFIKYWGNKDQDLRIPANGSISMNLGGLVTRTEVEFDSSLQGDLLTIGVLEIEGAARERVSKFLDIIREIAGIRICARVVSENNYPMGAGIASSAAAFAALALAGSLAAGLNLDERELSRLARRGSGSACRSIPAGFVEWEAGVDDSSSYADSIASPNHWDLLDCITIVSQEHKSTGSSAGHALAATSPLQAARVADAGRRLDLCRRAILEKDFETFADVVEQDSNMMHAVMLTSQPRLHYLLPATLAIMQSVIAWRAQGLPACYTIDAGPNVHVLCPGGLSKEVQKRLEGISGVEKVLTAGPGAAAKQIKH